MVDYRAVAPDDPSAHALLTEYFTGRELSFPSAQGQYRTTYPDPAAFVGDRGVFVIVHDDELGDVGCGGIRMLDDARAEVKHLYLQPRTRGRGLGRALLTELERRAAADFGARESVLDTNASLEAAGGLYAAAGYVGIPPYNDNPNATNWYAKALTSPGGTT